MLFTISKNLTFYWFQSWHVHFLEANVAQTPVPLLPLSLHSRQTGGLHLLGLSLCHVALLWLHNLYFILNTCSFILRFVWRVFKIFKSSIFHSKLEMLLNKQTWRNTVAGVRLQHSRYWNQFFVTSVFRYFHPFSSLKHSWCFQLFFWSC